MVDTARRAVAELAASQHRAFTRKQAAALNFDSRRIATARRDGWLSEPVNGVLTLRDAPATWEQSLMVVVLASGGRAVASHRSAARLHELDVPATWFEELLAMCLDDPDLPPMVLQHAILDETGCIVARPDIAFPSVQLGLEAHSREFHWGPLAEALDEDRDIAAALCGWELTYLGWYATKRPADVLRIVKGLVNVRRRSVRHGAA